MFFCKRLFLLLGAMMVPTQGSAIAQTEDAATLNPIVKMSDKVVSGCGIEILALKGAQQFSVSIVIERTSQGRATRLKAIATSSGSAENLAAIKEAFIETSGLSSREFFLPRRENPAGPFEVNAFDTRAPVGFLLQQILMGGATVGITQSGEKLIWKVSGPAPESVQSAYLTCAGDLYRAASASN